MQWIARGNFSPIWREVRYLVFHLYPSWAQVQKSKKMISACGRIGYRWCKEIIPKLGMILTDILTFHKLASSANLYRFTHFRKITFGCFFENCLLGQHPQSPSNIIFDDGCSFILNVLMKSFLEKTLRRNLHRSKKVLTPVDKLVFLSTVKYNKHRQLNRVCEYSS